MRGFGCGAMAGSGRAVVAVVVMSRDVLAENGKDDRGW